MLHVYSGRALPRLDPSGKNSAGTVIHQCEAALVGIGRGYRNIDDSRPDVDLPSPIIAIVLPAQPGDTGAVARHHGIPLITARRNRTQISRQLVALRIEPLLKDMRM